MSAAAVTPEGVRDGNPAAIAGLIERRGGAVLAYCAAVCPPELAVRAAAEAFARFRADVVAADDPYDVHPEKALLRATRQASAWLARTAPPAPSVGRLLRRKEDPVQHVPTLLVARAEGELSPADQHRLTQLLERSPEARAVQLSFRRGEEAYRDDATPDLEVQTHAILAAAMAAAAPVVTQAPASAAAPNGNGNGHAASPPARVS
jgi:hypothetical protein